MVVALACQLVLLPAICFGLVVLFDLPALLGIGMMLLAASPGGTTANLFSHLFRGDVALNITLTAINSVIAVVTLPLITGLAIAYYDRQRRRVDAARRDRQGVRARSWSRWASACSSRTGRPTSPTGWTGRCGSARP